MYPSPPTGISVVAYSNKVKISWVKNPETGIKGYNVYNSTTSGGGLSGYTKLNNALIETFSEVVNEVENTDEVVEINGSTRTTTITEQLDQRYVFTYTHENITEKNKQFYVIRAVNNIGEESVLSLEVEATPLTIPTEVFETPTRTINDISLDYITELLERDPLLDVKPGSVIRQLHVDPNSREMAWAYVREDFAMRSQSFLTLRVLDDSDGDGVSDPVVDSEYKTKLKQAYFFDSDTQVQELIDDSFDALSSNYGFIRQGATKSSTYTIFYTDTSPTSDVSIPLSEVISSIPTETQSAIQFSTLSSGVMEVSRIEDYYNAVTQRYELSIPIEAVLPGLSGNVNANTIVNTNIAGMSVTNVESAFGGVDEESNSDLADRAQLAFVGLDVGTVYGYKKTCAQIPGIRDVIVVTAGDSLMQRDYDEVRKKHVFGKVDIYIRGGQDAQTEDQVGFLYKQIINERFLIVDTADMIIQTSNLDVTTIKPIYEVSNVRNITSGKNYDLLGNCTIKKNSTITYEKGTQVSVDLITGEIVFDMELVVGDNITADYQYKQIRENEVIVGSALGGEIDFALDFPPIAKKSYVITKNTDILIEGTDYYLLLNGALHLYGSGLEPGDELTATYDSIITVTDEAVLLASGGETTASLSHGNIVESFLFGLDGVTLDLNSDNQINSSVGMNITDLISTTYRFRDSNSIVLSTQPVSSVLSVIGSVSGVLQPDVNYVLNKIDDILLEGNSSKSTRSISIKYANGIPTGNLTNNTENFVMVNNSYRQLAQYGIDTQSIIVRLNDVIYRRNNDYLVMPETDGLKVQLARSKTSSIPNGEEIQVEYNYGEIFTVTYQSNPLIKIAQDAVDISRHVTADVLVKGILETNVDMNLSVVLSSNANALKVIADIRTVLSNEFNKLKLGEGITQSDIIRAVENVSNVKSVVVPLAKMVKADGTQINREDINSSFGDFQQNIVDSYTTGIGALLHNTLGYGSEDGFYSIFENDRALVLVADKNDVCNASGQGFVGSNGEIVVSTLENDSATLHKYTVSYVVKGEIGSSDIDATSLEFLNVGEVVIITV